jgi:hypothetical protein
MINKYTLVYPNENFANEKIRINATLAVGDSIEWGDKFKITAIRQQFEPQSFDRSVTDDVVSFVVLALI